MIPAFLVTRFGPLGAKLIFFGGLALIFIAILSLTYCQGRSDGKQGEIIEQQEREIEVRRRLGDANTNAADTRVNDATNAAQQERELSDALNTTQDPDRQRALRGCAVLRQQGRDTSGIAACR